MKYKIEIIKNDVKDKLKRSSRFRKYFNNNGVNIKDFNLWRVFLIIMILYRWNFRIDLYI